MDSVANIIAYVLLFITGIAVLGIGTVIHISRLPPDNPLRRMLYAVSVRVGVTLGVGAVAAPLQVIPGLDLCVDAVSLVALAFVWLSLIREFRAAFADRPHVFVAQARKEAPVAQSTPPAALTGRIWVAPSPLSERNDAQPARLARRQH